MNPNWQELKAVGELPEIVLKSAERPQILFKHSTRCSISTMALNRLMKLDYAFLRKPIFIIWI